MSSALREDYPLGSYWRDDQGDVAEVRAKCGPGVVCDGERWFPWDVFAQRFHTRLEVTPTRRPADPGN